jgi:hypothetical protein
MITQYQYLIFSCVHEVLHAAYLHLVLDVRVQMPTTKNKQKLLWFDFVLPEI